MRPTVDGASAINVRHSSLLALSLRDLLLRETIRGDLNDTALVDDLPELLCSDVTRIARA